MSTSPSLRSQPLTGAQQARLLALVEDFARRRVLVIGDLIADEFIYGEVNRVSREAPVLILKYDATELRPGGAGNAASNVAALGARSSVAGLVGTDAEGRRLIGAFPRRVDARSVVRSGDYRTPVKTRILAGGIHSAKQQVVRIDREAGWPLAAPVSEAFTAKLVAALKSSRREGDSYDAIVLSDYGSGLITPALAEAVLKSVSPNTGGRSTPVLLDSRYQLLSYRGLTTCTPNEAEVEHLLGVHINDDLDVLETAGRTLLSRTGMQALLITRGSRGMALFEPKQSTLHIPIFGSDEVTDVTGAGDTVIATLALALGSGASFAEAARLANYAGGLVVMKRGTATITSRELADAIRSDG